ncbi:acyl-CoA N-acyltransferase [Trichoderma ceciliae]
MTIRVRESTQDDLPAIARIAAAAFHPKTDAIAARLFPVQKQEQEAARDSEAYSWRYAKKTASLYSPHAVMVVAVDDSLNDQVVGFGLWDVYSEKAANQPQSSVQEPPPPSFDQEAYAELRAIVSADHKEVFGERGIKDVWHLDYLGVDPQQQRKGIGKIVLDWGIRRAAEEKKDCYLLATPAGKTLYSNTGFEEVRVVRIFGVLHHSMLLRHSK